MQRSIRLLLLALVATSCSATPVPDDFRFIISAGAMHPAWPHSWAQIDAAGHGSCRHWSSALIDRKTLDSLEFEMSKESVARLWGAVERNHFFQRRSHLPDGRMQHGGYLSIWVVARGDTHDVTDYQVPVRPLVSILETMNQVVPERARIPAPFFRLVTGTIRIR